MTHYTTHCMTHYMTHHMTHYSTEIEFAVIKEMGLGEGDYWTRMQFRSNGKLIITESNNI